VLAVPECATPLFEGSGGYDPAWVGRPEHVELQRIFLRWQVRLPPRCAYSCTRRRRR
jgi:hypothetical protein